MTPTVKLVDENTTDPKVRAIFADIKATKKIDFKSDLFGTGTAPTSSLLAGDIEQLRNEYRKAGYREAQVSVSVSPADDDTPLAPNSAAIRAALVEAGAGDSLAVTFAIDEGRPTLLTAVELVPDDPADAPQLAQLCEPVLRLVRRVIPPIGQLDLSFLWLSIAIVALLILLR